MKIKRVLIFIVLPMSLAFALPQEQMNAPGSMILSKCLKQAALNNPELKAAFEEWKAASEQIPQAKSLEDPTLSFSYFIEEVETRVGPMDSKLSIMQKFPWFGELEVKEGVAAAKARAAFEKYEAVKLKLYYDVRKTYYEYSYLFTAIEIAKENLELIKHFEEIARTKYKTASLSHPDIIRAQIELAKLEDIFTSLNELRTPMATQLNALMNNEIDRLLPRPEKVPFVDVHFNHDNITQLLINSNPELARLDWEIRAAQKNVELARTRFYPDIGIGVDWTQIGPAVNSSTPDSGKDAVALMFSINIPLWQDNYKAGERQAQALLRKTRRQKNSIRNEKLSGAADILYDIEDNRRKVRLYGKTLLTKTEELIRASESAYKAGTVDFLSLINAQQMLLQYRLNHERALVDYQQKIAELEMLIGKELTLKNDTLNNRDNRPS